MSLFNIKTKCEKHRLWKRKSITACRKVAKKEDNERQKEEFLTFIETKIIYCNLSYIYLTAEMSSPGIIAIMFISYV